MATAAKAVSKPSKGPVKKPAPKKEIVNPIHQQAVPDVEQHASIADRVLLVGLSTRRWHPHVTDSDLSKEVAHNHQSDVSMGIFRKRLIPKELMAKVRSTINRIRDFHFYNTLAWSDEGYRILPSAGYFKYMEGMSALKAQFQKDVDEFLYETDPVTGIKTSRYNEMKTIAKKLQGSTFNDEDWPTEEQIAAKFGVEINPRPFPAGRDLRVNIGNDELRRIRQDLEAENQKILAASIKGVWERLHDVVEHAADRLKKYNVAPDGSTENPFRDTLVSNIVDLLDVIPALNVTDDPALTKFAARIKAEIALSPEVLRDDEKARKNVIQQADDILQKMGAFLK